jgi:ribulose-phosphate 3-epimerase
MSHIRITPSILNADHSRIHAEIARVSNVSDLIHLDIFDNEFAPNFSFTFEESKEIIARSAAPIDAHLMVFSADTVGPLYAEAGCASVTVHVEATKNISATARNIRSHGARASLAIKPGTSIEDYAQYVDEVDMFLIMTVEPGFGGQKFMAEMMEKVARTREIIGDRPIWLQVDGGISIDTIAIATAAGADTFVAGSAVFNAPDPAEMVTSLRKLAESVAN